MASRWGKPEYTPLPPTFQWLYGTAKASTAVALAPTASAITAATVTLTVAQQLSPSATDTTAATVSVTVAQLLSPSGAVTTAATCTVTVPSAVALTPSATVTTSATLTVTVPTPPPLPPTAGYPAGSAPKPFTYCLYNVLSGQFLGTLPLSQVTFGSQLLQPGTFSGILDVASQAVQDLGVFDMVQAGNVALLVDYLGSLIWGGFVWTAPYQQDDTKRQVQVNATEIWSWIQNSRVQATDYSAPPYSGITGNASEMPIWDASLTAVSDTTGPYGAGGGPGTYDPTLIAWQMLYDALYHVPNANLFGGTGIAANGYTSPGYFTTPNTYLGSGTNTPLLDYLSESYPYSSLQQLGSAINQLATLGLGVGFDYMVDVGGSAGGPVTCTINLSYPRRGRSYSQNNLVLDTQRALSFTIPPDATQTGNTLYEQGANGALSVSQNTQPLNGGAPIIERIMSRSNIQSANVMQVLQNAGAADLAICSYALYTPTVTTDLFTGPLQLGQFIVGDDVWWRIPATNGVGGTFCPRYPQGLNVEARIISYQAQIADSGTSQLTVTLSEPPSYSVQGPWLP